MHICKYPVLALAAWFLQCKFSVCGTQGESFYEYSTNVKNLYFHHTREDTMKTNF